MLMWYYRINIKYVYQIVKVIMELIIKRNKIVIMYVVENLRILLVFYMIIFIRLMLGNKDNIKMLRNYEIKVKMNEFKEKEKEKEKDGVILIFLLPNYSMDIYYLYRKMFK